MVGKPFQFRGFNKVRRQPILDVILFFIQVSRADRNANGTKKKRQNRMTKATETPIGVRRSSKGRSAWPLSCWFFGISDWMGGDGP